VLFIAGLVVAIAIVATGSMHDRAVFNEEARRIFQTLKQAREIYLFERRDVTSGSTRKRRVTGSITGTRRNPTCAPSARESG
jgi:hypothetical protein